MAVQANRNALDDAAENEGDEEDVTAPAIPESVLAAFLVALIGVITTAVTTAVSDMQPVTTPR